MYIPENLPDVWNGYLNKLREYGIKSIIPFSKEKLKKYVPILPKEFPYPFDMYAREADSIPFVGNQNGKIDTVGERRYLYLAATYMQIAKEYDLCRSPNCYIDDEYKDVVDEVFEHHSIEYIEQEKKEREQEIEAENNMRRRLGIKPIQITKIIPEVKDGYKYEIADKGETCVIESEKERSPNTLKIYLKTKLKKGEKLTIQFLNVYADDAKLYKPSGAQIVFPWGKYVIPLFEESYEHTKKLPGYEIKEDINYIILKVDKHIDGYITFYRDIKNNKSKR